MTLIPVEGINIKALFIIFKVGRTKCLRDKNRFLRSL